MTDNELDEMLDLWTVAPPSAALRARVSSPTAPPRRFSFRPMVFAGFCSGVAVAAVLVLSVVGLAFPQILPISPTKIPFVAESKLVAYADDGSQRIDSFLQSYPYQGKEMVADETMPGDPVRTFMRNVAAGITGIMLRFRPESAARDKWFNNWVDAGCTDESLAVIGHESILGYQTVVVQNTLARLRLTSWRSPDLACFALRVRTENLLPDGGYRLASQRDTFRVNMACRTRTPSGQCIERYSKYPFR